MESDFLRIINEHGMRYPGMEPQDYGKLAYQAEFGAGHFAAGRAQALEGLVREWDEVSSDAFPKEPEDIGGGLCRFPVSACRTDTKLGLLADLFVRTAHDSGGTIEGLRQKIRLLAEGKTAGMAEWLAEWERQGFPAVHHSPVYREAYRPHYRLLKKSYAVCFAALARIAALSQREEPAVIAIDGRCGSGKTHLAELVRGLFSCNVIHMDDFYLPLSRRQEDWDRMAGGNMDFERLNTEILTPIRSGRQAVYRPYDCSAGRITGERMLSAGHLTVIEGSYSHHPGLLTGYDFKIFLTCEKREQIRRLKEREGSGYPAFAARWMPMEEHYFQACGIEAGSDLQIDTSGFFV